MDNPETQVILLQKTEGAIQMNNSQTQATLFQITELKGQLGMNNPEKQVALFQTTELKGQLGMNIPEKQVALLKKTEQTIKNGQHRDTDNIVTENRRSNQEWTIQTQTTLLQKTEEAIKNGQQQRHRQHCFRKPNLRGNQE